LDKPNLIETDFQGFFNNVTHIGIAGELSLLGLPSSEIDFIGKLNRSIVQLPEELEVPEHPFHVRGNMEKDPKYDPNIEGDPTLMDFFWNARDMDRMDFPEA